jgi:hypothetical protein
VTFSWLLSSFATRRSSLISNICALSKPPDTSTTCSVSRSPSNANTSSSDREFSSWGSRIVNVHSRLAPSRVKMDVPARPDAEMIR